MPYISSRDNGEELVCSSSKLIGKNYRSRAAHHTTAARDEYPQKIPPPTSRAKQVKLNRSLPSHS